MNRSGTPKSILLVDDEPTVRESLKSALIKENFEVEEVESGKKAMDQLDKRPFDLIISDIQMPNSPIDGLALLKNVKQTLATPVILMTGFGDLIETANAFQLGAAGFLAKPFVRKDLFKIIRSILETEAMPEVNSEIAKQFTKLDIDDFISGAQIKTSIYVQLSNTKFVKVAHHGEDLSPERIRAYKEKGLKFLCIKKKEPAN